MEKVFKWIPGAAGRRQVMVNAGNVTPRRLSKQRRFRFPLYYVVDKARAITGKRLKYLIE